MTDYITGTKLICDSNEENCLLQKIDSPEYNAKVNEVLTKLTTKPKPIFSNFTKDERKALHNLRKDGNYIVLTADKGVALIIINKDMYIKMHGIT